MAPTAEANAHARVKRWPVVLWRRCGIFLQCAALMLACASCSAVFIKEPAGDQLVRLDPSLWEGIWVPRYEGAGTATPKIAAFERRLARPMYIKVADADKGILRVSWAESADGDFKLTGSDVYIRRQGHWLLASMPWPGGDGYWWARIEIFPAEEYRSEGSLVIWAPSGGRTSLGGSDLVETDPEWIVWMQATNDSTGTLWKIPTLYERIKLDGFEPGSGQRSAPGKDAPKD